jgi:hypothetical protein
MRLRTVVLALLLVPVTAGAAELLSPQDLKSSYFDGKPVTSTDARGHKSTFVFTADGKVTRTSGHGRTSDGTWTLSDTGFCMKIDKAKRDSCYIAVKDAGGLKVLHLSRSAFQWTR